MNILTILFSFVVVVMGFFLLFKIWKAVNQPLSAEQLQKLDKVEQFAQTLGTISAAVEDLKAQVGRDSALQADLQRVLGEVDSAAKEMARLRGEREADLREMQRRSDELHQKVSSIHSTLIGRKSGAVGENIVREALKHFPKGWVRSPYFDVEFGLILFGGRVIPVDSKFSGAELLEQLNRMEPGVEKETMAEQIEKRILTRAREVAKYIDPSATTSVAICAVPDSAYQVLKKAHLQSYEDYRVVILSYSMVLPFLLMMYDFHLKAAGQMDEARLEAFILSIEKAIKDLRGALENKVKEAGTRIGNAYRECVQSVEIIETAVAILKASRLPAAPQPEKIGVLNE